MSEPVTKAKKDLSTVECANCGTPGAPVGCARCKLVGYCDKSCQKQHWKMHKKRCIPLKDRSVHLCEARDEAECAICLLSLVAEVCTLPCGHKYHAACIKELRTIGVKQSCPSCRATLPPDADKLFDDAMELYKLVKSGTASWDVLTKSQQRKMDTVLLLLREAADQGHALSQFRIGVMYDKGQGVAKNAVESARWFHMAANQGFRDAQFILGCIYQWGDGVEKNYAQSNFWLHKAAEQNDPGAQYGLYLIYKEGIGVKPNQVEAVAWCRKAAHQGYETAQYCLGLMYLVGQSVEQSDDLSLEWFTKAAAKGNVAAQDAISRAAAKGNAAAQKAMLHLFLHS
jgi:hypothetical protein